MCLNQLSMNSPSSFMYKKVKNYFISYTKQDYYGINEHGEIRRGFYKENGINKLIVVRVTRLPLTNNLLQFFQQQQNYSNLCTSTIKIFGKDITNSYQYIYMQYVPKTFESQIQNFMKNKKYFYLMVNHFLKIYALFYHLGIPHGNLKPSNIGITFDDQIKLMDFQVIHHSNCEKSLQQDFDNFEFFISRVMENCNHKFPTSFQSFNSAQNRNWQHLFSIWHIISPLEALYIPRKYPIDNIVSLLQKLYISIQTQCTHNNDIKMSIRLLQWNFLNQSQSSEHISEKISLERIVGKIEKINFDYFNSIIMSVLTDPIYYQFTQAQRLVLIASLIPEINHQYLFYDVLNELNAEQEDKKNQILGNSLISKYWQSITNNLLKNNQKIKIYK